ncbi:hypothetical protein [Burkholderia phage BCSR5]|nr:hypothetical protein [Burkholderia phage BCSR5]
MKRIFGLIALVLSAGLASAQQPKLEGFDLKQASIPPFEVPAFYNTVPVAGMTVGTLLAKEELSVPNAKAWRIMYVSERSDGTHVPASGIVVSPKAASVASRPVVVWAHGTTGTARGCAPSLAPNPARQLVQRGSEENLPIDIGIPFLNDWIANGYTVVAPDYAGLGSNAMHHYLLGEDAARDIHNMVRAARSLHQANAGTDVALFGWSQGGQAVLFAGENGKAYAPDNKIRSIVALAPAATIMSPAINAIFKSKTPYALMLSAGYIDAYKVDRGIFTEDGQKLLASTQKNCVVSMFGDIAKSGPAITSNVSDNPGWAAALALNNAGSKASSPVLVYQGTTDMIVPPASTKAYTQRATAAGTQVQVTVTSSSRRLRSLLGSRLASPTEQYGPALILRGFSRL